jgi:hypothetical protein
MEARSDDTADSAPGLPRKECKELRIGLMSPISSQLLKNAEFALQALSTSFPDVLQFGADEIQPADIAQGYERVAHTCRVR